MCGIVCVIGDAVCVVLACDWPSRISRMRRGGQRVVPKLVSHADMFAADAYHCRGRLVESGWSSRAEWRAELLRKGRRCAGHVACLLRWPLLSFLLEDGWKMDPIGFCCLGWVNEA